jgi:hypothetical protein
MIFPTVQSVVDKLLTPLGWGAVISGILGVSGWLVKKFIADITERADDIQADLKEVRSNHLSHIEAYGAQTVVLLQAQNVSLASMAEASKDTAVALAEIKTLLSVK